MLNALRLSEPTVRLRCYRLQALTCQNTHNGINWASLFTKSTLSSTENATGFSSLAPCTDRVTHCIHLYLDMLVSAHSKCQPAFCYGQWKTEYVGLLPTSQTRKALQTRAFVLQVVRCAVPSNSTPVTGTQHSIRRTFASFLYALQKQNMLMQNKNICTLAACSTNEVKQRI